MITEEKRQGIIADRLAGMAIYDISRKYHTHFYAVRDICRDLPGKSRGRPPKLTPEQISSIKERRKSESVNTIAKSLGVTRQHIYLILSTVDRNEVE